MFECVFCACLSAERERESMRCCLICSVWVLGGFVCHQMGFSSNTNYRKDSASNFLLFQMVCVCTLILSSQKLCIQHLLMLPLLVLVCCCYSPRNWREKPPHRNMPKTTIRRDAQLEHTSNTNFFPSLISQLAILLEKFLCREQITSDGWRAYNGRAHYVQCIIQLTECVKDNNYSDFCPFLP